MTTGARLVLGALLASALLGWLALTVRSETVPSRDDQSPEDSGSPPLQRPGSAPMDGGDPEGNRILPGTPDPSPGDETAADRAMRSGLPMGHAQTVYIVQGTLAPELAPRVRGPIARVLPGGILRMVRSLPPPSTPSPPEWAHGVIEVPVGALPLLDPGIRGAALAVLGLWSVRGRPAGTIRFDDALDPVQEAKLVRWMR